MGGGSGGGEAGRTDSAVTEVMWMWSEGGECLCWGVEGGWHRSVCGAEYGDKRTRGMQAGRQEG